MRRTVTSIVCLMFAGLILTSMLGIFRDGVRNIDEGMSAATQSQSILSYE